MKKLLSAFLLVACTAAAAKEPVSAALPQTREKLEPFLKEYCFRCHGEKRQKGQVRFDTAEWDITNNDVAQRWQDVLDQLNGGDMPPEDADLPSDDELANALDILTGAVNEARQRLTDHGGEIKMRRLNQREYSATIRDLFGFGVNLNDIPEDGEIATFDTVGAEQYFNSSHFEKYLELGKKIGFESFRFNYSKRRDVKIETVQPEERVTQKIREKVADLDKKMAMKEAGKGWKEMGFKDEGEMQIIFQQWDSRAEKPRKYLQYPHVDQGVYISDIAKWASHSQHVDVRGEHIFRIRGGIVGDPPEIRKMVRLWDRNEIRGTMKMDGTPENPGTIEMRVRQNLGSTHLSLSVRENVPLYTINSMRGYIQKVAGPGEPNDPRPSIYIDSLEIEGPFYPEKRPKIEDILFPNEPTGSKPFNWAPENVNLFIEKFTFEAFRRKAPEPEFLEGLKKRYLENIADGLNSRDAMVEVIGIILASPGFLFIQEAGPAEPEGHRQLDNRELAIRLSYFLWSSPPDDELYAANLHGPAVFESQLDRMLADPKAEEFRNGFVSQWAEFDRYDAITVDHREHHLFNEGVKQDAKQEVREFFGVLIDENLPALNLIDSDFLTVNNALATHYGIDLPNSKTAEFQKIQLPADSPRGGLMTQTAFLTTGSNGERSSPVIRGALVMEKLLHDEPAPPPPNVPELGAASGEPRSNREMVIAHQEQAVCSSCHKKMDVIGFGLENFDTVGRWRDTEKVGRKQVPIEPRGTLPDGTAFKNVQELKSVLLKNEDRLAHQLTESMMTYALGRTIEFSDADDVEEILAKIKKDGYPMRSMIREIAKSELFRRK